MFFCAEKYKSNDSESYPHKQGWFKANSWFSYSLLLGINLAEEILRCAL